MIALALVAVGLPYILSSLPSSEKIGERLETLQALSEDGSFQARMDIGTLGISAVLRSPLGTGLGSTGLAGRVNTGVMEAGAVIGDNGYFEILLTFGWLGSFFFFYALFLIWRNLLELERTGQRTDAIMMSKALVVTGAAVMVVGNWLVGPSALMFCIFVGFALAPSNGLINLKRLLTLLALIEAQESSQHAENSSLKSNDSTRISL